MVENVSCLDDFVSSLPVEDYVDSWFSWSAPAPVPAPAPAPVYPPVDDDLAF